jgi:D-sedoheptulose 7-phosphate isomerase
VANDFGFEKIFSRAVECLTPNQDTLIALSTSGQSPNIVAATKCAQERSVFCLFLGGPAGGPAADYADCKLLVHGDQTARIQEIHALTLHCLGIWIRGVHQNNATH